MKAKIALVTGGSRGLGRDIALSLAEKNIDVIITYRSQKEEAKQVVHEIIKKGQKGLAMPFDISDTGAIGNFIKQVQQALQDNWQESKFDFLINNAGAGDISPIPEVTEETFGMVSDINFKGVYFLTQKSLEIMNDNGGVVFISSGTTRFTIPAYSVYACVKAAIETFSRYVAKEFGSRGIRSNVVAPGPIETDLMKNAFANDPQLKTYLESQTAMGRIGQPQDVGGVVAFLCTEGAKWVTAQRIEASGGMQL